jgi:hypothetical protein
MRSVPIKFLAAALAGSLAVVYCRPLSVPDKAPSLPAPDEGEAQPGVGYLRALAMSRITREVADGRRTLLEAAALFRELKGLLPELPEPHWDDTPMAIPTDTAEGRLCRQVALHVSAALRAEPGRAAAAVARLEADFFAELRAQGAVRLPDPSSLESVEGLLAEARIDAEGRRAR